MPAKVDVRFKPGKGMHAKLSGGKAPTATAADKRLFLRTRSARLTAHRR